MSVIGRFSETCSNNCCTSRTLAELVEVPREKSFSDDETAEDSVATRISCVHPEAEVLGLVFADILR